MEETKLSITKDELHQMLHSGIVRIEFTKKDGSHRVMDCTLSAQHMPERTQAEDGKEAAPAKALPDNMIRVYEPEKEAFRTVNIDRLTADPVMIDAPQCSDCAGGCVIGGDCIGFDGSDN